MRREDLRAEEQVNDSPEVKAVAIVVETDTYYARQSMVRESAREGG